MPQEGTYSFSTNSDDGSILKIGSTLVVNNDGIHGIVEQSGSIALKAGKHAFTVGYIQGGNADVTVQGTGTTSISVPAGTYQASV